MAPLVLLAACARQPTAAEKAAAEQADIAQVEAIQRQKPPPRPLQPQPILYADIERHGLFAAGCAFAPGDSIGAVLLAQDKAGYLKLNGRVVRFASDPGSAKLPLGAWSRYTGRDHAIALTRVAGAGEEAGGDGVRWRGHLTVTDAHDQVVYDAEGLVQCG